MVAPHPGVFNWNNAKKVPPPLRAFKATLTPQVEAAVTPLLLAHRAFVFAEYLGNGAPFPLR